MTPAGPPKPLRSHARVRPWTRASEPVDESYPIATSTRIGRYLHPRPKINTLLLRTTIHNGNSPHAIPTIAEIIIPFCPSDSCNIYYNWFAPFCPDNRRTTLLDFESDVDRRKNQTASCRRGNEHRGQHAVIYSRFSHGGWTAWSPRWARDKFPGRHRYGVDVGRRPRAKSGSRDGAGISWKGKASGPRSLPGP